MQGSPRYRFLGLLAVALAIGAASAERAYVPNEGSGTLSVIDTATDRESADSPLPRQGSLGEKLRGVALDRRGTTLFVVDAARNLVLVVDPTNGAIKKTLPSIASAEGIELAPDGRTLAVCAELSNEAVFIDATALTERFRVKVQGSNPEHCVFSPDGRWLLTSNESSRNIDVIDVAAHKSVRLIKTDGAPRGMGFLPNGRAVYVANETAGTVDVVATDSWQVTKSIPIGERPAGIIVRRDGARVYATSGGSGTVSVIDPKTDAVLARIVVGQRPWNMALTGDGKKLYVANGRSNTVSVIDTTTNVVVHTIASGARPWGVVIR